MACPEGFFLVFFCGKQSTYSILYVSGLDESKLETWPGGGHESDLFLG